MPLGWIYAFADRGFARGIKIGRDKNHPDRFRRAQCYTPRGIDLVASWRVHDGFGTLARAEMAARGAMPLVSGENCGAEWCDVNPQEAVDRVSRNLRFAPECHAGNPSITTTYDDFR